MEVSADAELRVAPIRSRRAWLHSSSGPPLISQPSIVHQLERNSMHSGCMCQAGLRKAAEEAHECELLLTPHHPELCRR